MKTIKELTAIASDGESAQDQLNDIANNIYDVYVQEIETQTKNLEREFPSFCESVSELTRCANGFHSYRLDDTHIWLMGRDYFRGETNYEYDSLPVNIFIDDVEERNRLIKEFVTNKIESIRNGLIAQHQTADEADRQQYEALRKRFEIT